MRGTALVEFALAWPVALLLVLGCVELSVWSVESYVARYAAVAGARAGTVAGSGPRVAADVAVRALGTALAGATATAWCPGDGVQPAGAWVCATDRGGSIEVRVGGTVPALVPLIGVAGLPLAADVALDKERFAP